ncbi:hypothetical protein Pmani_025684 [Petrolisthes manimaculis]|uniref:Uncharacterized protein n=1 Tax=Petrolisthes manimaculis TaxID=1843537 RepID=A0AAE1P7F7_9EUCA|nr:hypothetical protein Pmani_025684 [Petrolisthes manimaculis]
MSNHPVTLPITELSPPYLSDCPPVTQPASSPALSASVPVCLRIQIYLTYLFPTTCPHTAQALPQPLPPSFLQPASFPTGFSIRLLIAYLSTLHGLVVMVLELQPN